MLGLRKVVTPENSGCVRARETSSRTPLKKEGEIGENRWSIMVVTRTKHTWLIVNLDLTLSK